MTRDDLILATLPAVIANQKFISDDHARAGQCMGSSVVAIGTLDVVKAMEAAILKEQPVEH